MTIERKLLGTTPVSSGIEPEAVSFDGSTGAGGSGNDYLIRNSDLTNNADGKTFTVSFWIYYDYTASNIEIYNSKTSGGNVYGLRLRGLTSGFSFNAYNSSGTRILLAYQMTVPSANTWVHCVGSFDLTNSSNCKVYINDVDANASFIITNDTIDFTKPQHLINNLGSMKGRLSNLFLDYTYRDLSIEANRRLFIDADGKPSKTIPSSPILYLPMTDAATAGSNSGTGGDFTVNGVLATAERGPNQDNCSASVFDGSNDYLSSVSTTTVGTDSKVFTLAYNAKSFATGYPIVFALTSGIEAKFSSQQGKVSIIGTNSAGSEILNIHTGSTPHFTQDENVAVVISVDMASQSNTKIYLNGTSLPITFYTFTNDTLKFTDRKWWVGRRYGGSYLNGSLGEVYFNSTYTDLATDNPFWDSDTNRPNSVRKVIEDTGVTPLIALPMIGNDAGNNLGSGGDFTVNSGPYTGARGGSEFWARSANLGTSSQEKTFAKNLGISTKIVTVVFASKPTAAYIEYIASTPTGAPYTWFMINSPSNNYITIEGQNSTRKVLDSTASSATSEQRNNEWNINFISFDLSDTSKRIHWLQNSVRSNAVTRNYGTYINDVIDLSVDDFIIGGRKHNGVNRFSGDFGFTYVSTTFIDFSQEANRNKFVDQLGYPRDLTQQIEDGDIPNPLVYMKFDDPAALGTNSGTVGNFTVLGAPTSGSDFSI